MTPRMPTLPFYNGEVHIQWQQAVIAEIKTHTFNRNMTESMIMNELGITDTECVT